MRYGAFATSMFWQYAAWAALAAGAIATVVLIVRRILRR
jgi:hypothetical protein